MACGSRAQPAGMAIRRGKVASPWVSTISEETALSVIRARVRNKLFFSVQLTPRSMPPLARRNCNRWTLPARNCSDSIVPGLVRTPGSTAMGSFLAGGAPFFPPPLKSRLPCNRPPCEPLTNVRALSNGCATAERA